MESSLRHATLAATNQRTTATLPEKALAWTSLQRLRHNLEELQASGRPAHAEQHGHRVVHAISSYLLGEREVTFNVDADALRCWVLLLDLGVVPMMYSQQATALLVDIGDTVLARALSILSPDLQDQWHTTPYLCDICGIATATLAVHLSLCLDTFGHDAEDTPAHGDLKALGARLHAALKKLGSLRHDDVLKTSQTMDHLQVAYMSALRPARASRCGPCATACASPISVIPVLLPVLCAYAIMTEGGFQAAFQNMYVVVGLVVVVVLAVLALAVPCLCSVSMKAKRERAVRISEMLVEMSMNICPTKEEFGIGKVWGIYVMSPSGAVEKKEMVKEDPSVSTASTASALSENTTEGATGNTTSSMSSTASTTTTETPEPLVLTQEEREESRKLLSAVQQLGEITVASLGVATVGEEMKEGEEKEGHSKASTIDDGVKIPFPKELLVKMEDLVRMMKESGSSASEIEKVANKLAMVRQITNRQKIEHARGALEIPSPSANASLPAGPPKVAPVVPQAPCPPL